MYYIWAVLLILANGFAWLTNFLNLPGNWFIVGLTAVFAWLWPEGADPAAAGRGVSWTTVGVVAGLALFGEVLEFAAGAAGAAKRGGSRRGMLLAIAGAFVGSIAGAVAGVPIPVIGPLVGALGGGMAGAFVGAFAGEAWKGRTAAESFDIGRSAMIGRLVGTVGKIAVGAIMVVIVAADALL